MQTTLTARVARQVMEAAEQGMYKPSDRLPSERELAEQLMVSRTTVTAAYTNLEQQGLIRRIQGKGAYLCALPACEEAFSWSGKISRFANALDEPVLELLARRCADQVPHPLSAGTPSLDIFPGAVRRRPQAGTGNIDSIGLGSSANGGAVGAADSAWKLD